MTSKEYGRAAYRKARAKLKGQPCHWCGGPGGTADHVTAIVHGGANTAQNLVPACQSCNSRRGAHQGRSRRRGRRQPAKSQRNRRW